METKSEIRHRILQLRDNLSPADRKKSQILVTDRIIGHQWYYKAEELLIFISNGSEIDTKEIIEDAFHHGKKVFVPKVMGETMEFIKIAKGEELIPGYKGILEPELTKSSERFEYDNAKQNKVLMIMPGAAFDLTRNRIGYGKGFYDRYLQDKEGLHTIAIGFDCQMVAKIMASEQDVKPDQVICL